MVLDFELTINLKHLLNAFKMDARLYNNYFKSDFKLKNATEQTIVNMQANNSFNIFEFLFQTSDSGKRCI